MKHGKDMIRVLLKSDYMREIAGKSWKSYKDVQIQRSLLLTLIRDM